MSVIIKPYTPPIRDRIDKVKALQQELYAQIEETWKEIILIHEECEHDFSTVRWRCKHCDMIEAEYRKRQERQAKEKANG